MRIMAAILLPALHKYLGFNQTTSSDAVLATQIKPLLTAERQPSMASCGQGRQILSP